MKRGAGIVDVESEVAESLNYFRGVGSLLDPPRLGKLRASQPFTKMETEEVQVPAANSWLSTIKFKLSALGSPDFKVGFKFETVFNTKVP